MESPGACTGAFALLPARKIVYQPLSFWQEAQ